MDKRGTYISHYVAAALYLYDNNYKKSSKWCDSSHDFEFIGPYNNPWWKHFLSENEDLKTYRAECCRERKYKITKWDTRSDKEDHSTSIPKFPDSYILPIEATIPYNGLNFSYIASWRDTTLILFL